MKKMKLVYKKSGNEYELRQRTKDRVIIEVFKNGKYYGLICGTDIIEIIDKLNKVGEVK